MNPNPDGPGGVGMWAHGRAGHPRPARRGARPSAARRAALAAAVAIAATMAVAHAGDGTTQHHEFYIRVEFSPGRVASLTRQQVAAAFGSKVAAANVEVPKGDFDAAVDNAVRQLANWKGETALRGCSGQLCYEVVIHNLGMGQ